MLIMKIFILFLLITKIFASNYPTFSKQDLKLIKYKSGYIAKNRVVDYSLTMRRLKKFPRRKQLVHVNRYLNQLLQKPDSLNQDISDYWETPKEFLCIGFGDCEDYAIIKYFTLIKLGFPKNRLFLTTVYVKSSGTYHMVVSYFEYFLKPPLILDNLSFRILNTKERDDLVIGKFINHQGVFKLNQKNQLIWIANSYKKHQDLLKRISKEKPL